MDYLRKWAVTGYQCRDGQFSVRYGSHGVYEGQTDTGGLCFAFHWAGMEIVASGSERKGPFFDGT